MAIVKTAMIIAPPWALFKEPSLFSLSLWCIHMVVKKRPLVVVSRTFKSGPATQSTVGHSLLVRPVGLAESTTRIKRFAPLIRQGFNKDCQLVVWMSLTLWLPKPRGRERPCYLDSPFFPPSPLYGWVRPHLSAVDCVECCKREALICIHSRRLMYYVSVPMRTRHAGHFGSVSFSCSSFFSRLMKSKTN